MDTGQAGRMVLVEPPHPPLDFPIVGLADPAGQRWVDLFVSCPAFLGQWIYFDH